MVRLSLKYLLLFISFLLGIIQNVVLADTQCPTIPSKPQDSRLISNQLRVVQYNTEWLFIDQYQNCPGSGCSWSNQTEAQTHLKYVAAIINELSPDIINICEVEGCDELSQLVSLTNNKFHPYLIQGTDSATGQNVGMLTLVDPVSSLYRTEDRYTYPIPNSKCGYTGSSGTQGVSKHYITKFNINNINIAMIGAHLLAYPTDTTRCAEREAQAQVLQNHIYELYNEGNEIIVLGDFNDFDNLVIDANDNIPKSQVLDILKGNSGTYAGKYELSSVAQSISKSNRYTDWYDENSDCKSESNEFSMIDHILVSSKLYNKISSAWIYHAYDEFCGTYNSDHYPVVVDFNL